MGLAWDNMGQVGFLTTVFVVYVFYYPKARRKLPSDFVRTFLDSIYSGMRNSYWAIVLFVNRTDKKYIKKLVKVASSSNYCHISGIANLAFSPKSDLYIPRFVISHRRKKGTAGVIDNLEDNITVGRDFSLQVLEGNLPNKVVFILGNAGYGKSSLAKRICLDLIDQDMGSSPLFLDISNKNVQLHLNQIISETDEYFDIFGGVCGLSRLISEHWKTKGMNIPPQFFFKRIKKGCHVIIDGFDEIEQYGDRYSVLYWLEELKEKYDNCTFIIFSRPFAFDELHERNSCAFSLQGLFYDQIKSFVLSFFRLANEELKTQNELCAEEYCKEFMRRLGSDITLINMSTNPLLLTFMVYLHFTERQLPENKSELCRDILVSSLSWHRKEISPNEKKTITNLLASVAFAGNFKNYDNILMERELIKKTIARKINDTGFNSKEDLSSHLINNAAIVESVNWNIPEIKFVHKSFLEYFIALHLSNNDLYEVVANSCDNDDFQEILSFYIYIEENLDNFFIHANKIARANKERVESIARVLYWVLETTEEEHKNKLTDSIKKSLSTRLKNGVSRGDRSYIKIHTHLRLSRLLSSDPLDRYPLTYKECLVLGVHGDKCSQDNNGNAVGMGSSTIDSLIGLINEFYDNKDIKFCLPHSNALPMNFKDDAIVQGPSGYQVYNSSSHRFKKIREVIKREVLLDFLSLQKCMSAGVSFGFLLDKGNVEIFVDTLMEYWTPNITIQGSTPAVTLTNKNIYDSFMTTFYPYGTRSLDEAIKKGALDIFTSGMGSMSASLVNIVKSSWDAYHDASNFNYFCRIYLEDKTNYMLKEKLIHPWGKIYLSYQLNFPIVGIHPHLANYNINTHHDKVSTV